MSSLQTNTTGTDGLRPVAAAIREHDRFLLTTHENPDGDSLGSILALQLALRQLGKDSVMYLQGTTPLPKEYEFMELNELRRGPPPDPDGRVVVALDCANERRPRPQPTLLKKAPLVPDNHHHHQKPR